MAPSLSELSRALAAIERTLDTRVEIWRIVIDEHGHEIGRIYRGSFQRPHSQGEPK